MTVLKFRAVVEDWSTCKDTLSYFFPFLFQGKSSACCDAALVDNINYFDKMRFLLASFYLFSSFLPTFLMSLTETFHLRVFITGGLSCGPFFYFVI